MPSNFLSLAFAKDGTYGRTFYQSLQLPHDDKTLHSLIHEKKCPTISALKQSYGHVVTEKRATCPDHLPSPAEKKKRLKEQFASLNDVTLTLTQRMQLLETMNVGGAMVVTRGLGTAPAITLVSNVVSTRVDMADSAHLGAPNLSTILPDSVASEYSKNPTVPDHMFLGSLAHDSRTVIHSDRSEWLEALLPVYMGPASSFAATPGESGVCQVLFFPHLSEIPTGLFWPADTSLDDFMHSLKSGATRPTVFGHFHYLLETFSPMFEAWFRAVNAHPLSFVVRMESAVNLLNYMPSLNLFEPDDKDTVEQWSPLLCQVESFLQDACYDAYLCGPTPQAKKEKKGRMQLLVWLTRCLQCYPVSLLSEVPIQRRPFLLTMFPLPDGGADLDWTGPFEDASSWPIPKEFALYGSAEIPVRPTAAFTAVRLEKAPAEEAEDDEEDDDDDDMAAYLKMLDSAALSLGPEKAAATAAARFQIPQDSTPQDASRPTATVTPATDGRANRSRSRPPPPPVGTSILEVPDSPIRQGTGVNMPSATSFLQALGHPPGYLQQPAGVSPYATLGTPQATNPLGATVTPEVAGIAQWTQIAALAGLTQNLNEVLGSTTPSGRRSKRFDTVFKCSIRSALFRKRCDPSFLQGALLLAHVIHDVRPMYTTNGGPIPSHTLMLVKEPTELGRNCFAGLDAGNNGSESVEYIIRLMEYRASQSGPSFPFYGVLLDEDLWSELTPTWVAGAFKPSSWRIDFQRLAPRTGATRPWHLLDILPMVNPQYSWETLPADGITWEEAQQFGCLLYLLMSSIGVTEPTRMGGDYDDSLFSNSIFGSVLLFMCRVPLNPLLKSVWTDNPRLCTGRWFTDMCELFNMVQRMVRHQIGSSFATCGFDDAYFDGDAHATLVVVKNSASADSFFGTSLTYVIEMQNYYNTQRRFWAVRRFPTTEQAWSCAGHEVFFPTSHSPHPLASESLVPAGSKSRKRKADADSKVKPPAKGMEIKNVHPLFVCLKPDGGDPFENVLQKQMEIGDSPKILCPETGKKRHQVCLRSAFVSCNTCNLPKWQCAARHRGKSTSEDIGRERFHVDLSKKRWSASAYKEENWNPIVEFIKKYKDYIGPSDHLKAVTPNTVWA